MTTFERLKTAYINTNKLRYVSRDFPAGSNPSVGVERGASREVRRLRKAGSGKCATQS